MAYSQIKYLKSKMGLKGETKTGDMIAGMNAMKGVKYKKHSASALSGLKKFVSEEVKEKSSSMYHCKTHGMHFKSHAAHLEHMKSHSMKHKSDGIKKTGKSFGKSNKLGGGGRFRQVEHAVAGKKGVYNPAGLAAYIGRKSLGKARFQKLAAKARKHSK